MNDKQLYANNLISKTNEIENKISELKDYCAMRRQQRVKKIYNYQKQINKIIQENQCQRQKSLQERRQKMRYQFERQYLKGLVIQVPQKEEILPLMINPYSPRNNLYFISQVIKTYKNLQSPVRLHLTASLNILKSLEQSQMLTRQQLKPKMLTLPIKPGFENRKVMIFDLDETLIHCNDTIEKKYDIKITIKFPTGESLDAGINIRPYAKQLLTTLSKKYEIMIFTASHSCYANQILDYIDPQRTLIQHRLYRQHCQLTSEGYFVKDLRIINRKLSDMLLIDNAAYSYAYQIDNGIPILSYYNGNMDFQLKALERYLMEFESDTDVRHKNRHYFKIGTYLNYIDQVEKLVQDLYMRQDSNKY